MWENARSLLKCDGATWVAPGGGWVREAEWPGSQCAQLEFVALLLDSGALLLLGPGLQTQCVVWTLIT